MPNIPGEHPVGGSRAERREALTPAEMVELVHLQDLLRHAAAAKLVMAERLLELIEEAVQRAERR